MPTEQQPLAFFDLSTLLERLPSQGTDGVTTRDIDTSSLTNWPGDGYSFDKEKLELKYELAIQRKLVELERTKI